MSTGERGEWCWLWGLHGPDSLRWSGKGRFGLESRSEQELLGTDVFKAGAVVVTLSGVLFVDLCLPEVPLTLFVERQVIVGVTEWQA